MAEDWQEQVIEMTAESLGVPNPEEAHCNKMCSRAWEAFDDHAYDALEAWVKKHPRSLKKGIGFDDLWEEEGEYLIYMTIAGEGVGIWDGSWHHFFRRPEEISKKLVPYLKGKLSKHYEILEHAIVDSAYETAQEAEDERPPSEEEIYDSVVIRYAYQSRGGHYQIWNEGHMIEQVKAMEEAISEANIWMDKNEYWPNLYFINERGNIDLLDKRGNVVKSWV